MRITEQVHNSLYRVEGDSWDFNESGVPERHRSVPETRQFKNPQFFSVLVFCCDDGGGGIKVKRVAV